MNDVVRETEFLEKKLKPQLQEIIENIKIEERPRKPNSEPGECL